MAEPEIVRTQSADGGVVVEDPGRRRAILIAACAALMAVVASASALNVAQQEIARDLDASQGQVLWILNAYVVALAALLLPMGAIADRWGRRRVLVAGLCLFIGSTAAAGLADSVWLMIGARVAAGVSAAMVMPVTLSVITASFPPAARTQAIGVWTAVAGGGGLLGMIAAAVLVDVATWRLLFALPAGLGAAALLMTVRSVPDSRERREGVYDAWGAALSVVAAGGLVIGIQQGPVHGWTVPSTVLALVGGLAALAAFVVHELRSRSPLLEIRTFRDRRLASGSVALLMVFGISAGIFVVLFPYLQAVLGWSAMRSMLGLLPMIAVMMGASGQASKVVARVGARATMLAGVATIAVGLAAMAALVSTDAYLSVLPGLLLVGLGMGLAMPPATESITSALPLERQGVASALNDTTRELGSALGVALLGAIFTAVYAARMNDARTDLPNDAVRTASDGIARAFDVAARQADTSQATALIDAARHAFVGGWAASMWVGAAAMAAVFAGLLWLTPSAELERPQDEPTGRHVESRPPAASEQPLTTEAANS